jgi:hypothetical protein
MLKQGPQAKFSMLFLYLEKFGSQALTYSFMSPSLRPCISQSRPNQSKLQLTKLQYNCSSTTLLLPPTANSSWIRSNKASKCRCQSPHGRRFSSTVADRPQAVTVVWARCGARTLAAVPPVRSHEPQGRHAIHRSSPSIPSFLPLCTPKRKNLAAAMPRAHRRTIISQTTSTEPPPVPLPSPLLHWTNRAKVRPHWSISPPRPCAGPLRSSRPPWSG